MLEKLKTLDTDLFIYLNSLGSEPYDAFWLFITKQTNWTPLFLLFLYLIYKKLGTKQTLYLLLFVAVLVTFTDQTTNFVKNTFQRSTMKFSQKPLSKAARYWHADPWQPLRAILPAAFMLS